MILASSGDTFFSIVFAIYIVGLFIAFGIYSLLIFFARGFSMGRSSRKRGPQHPARDSFLWPLTLVRLVAGTSRRAAGEQGGVAGSDPQPVGGQETQSDAGLGDLQVRRYGLIDEEDT